MLLLDQSGVLEEFDSFEAYFDAVIAYARRTLTQNENGDYT